MKRILMISCSVLFLVACGKKEFTANKNQHNVQEVSSVGVFDPDQLTESEIQTKITDFLDELESGTIESNRSVDEAAWLLEAALNWYHSDFTRITTIDVYEFDHTITQTDSFYGQDLLTTYNQLHTTLSGPDVLPDSNVIVKLIDVELIGGVLNVNAVRARSNFPNYRWLCHPAQEYPIKSLFNQYGYGPLYNCPNGYFDNAPVYGIMEFIANEVFMGFDDCPTTTPLVACPKQYYHSIGSVDLNHAQVVSPPDQYSGIYDGAYDRLLPRIEVQQSVVIDDDGDDCHNGPTIRGLINNRIVPHVNDIIQANHQGYRPLNLNAGYHEALNNITYNGTGWIFARFSYGKCIWINRGRPDPVVWQP